VKAQVEDLAALDANRADDYVFVNGHGHGQLRTKADRIADIRSGASSIDSITHEEAPIVKTHGKTTLVLSRVTIVGTYSAAKSRTTSAACTSGSTRMGGGGWCSTSSRLRSEEVVDLTFEDSRGGMLTIEGPAPTDLADPVKLTPAIIQEA
jgi:hypothetical protein